VLAALLLFACGAFAIAGGPQIGDLPPDALGKDGNGNPVRVSDYRGKIVVISFWASWCLPCRQEMPWLARIQQQATRDKLLVVAVNWKESREKFRAIRNSLKDIDLTLVSDANGNVGAYYGVHAIPHMVIVGRDGRIARVHVGYSADGIPELVDEINELWTRGAAEPAAEKPGDSST